MSLFSLCSLQPLPRELRSAFLSKSSSWFSIAWSLLGTWLATDSSFWFPDDSSFIPIGLSDNAMHRTWNVMVSIFVNNGLSNNSIVLVWISLFGSQSGQRVLCDDGLVRAAQFSAFPFQLSGRRSELSNDLYNCFHFTLLEEDGGIFFFFGSTPTLWGFQPILPEPFSTGHQLNLEVAISSKYLPHSFPQIDNAYGLPDYVLLR